MEREEVEEKEGKEKEERWKESGRCIERKGGKEKGRDKLKIIHMHTVDREIFA